MNKEAKLQNSTQTEEWQKYSKNRQKIDKRQQKKKGDVFISKNCSRAKLFKKGEMCLSQKQSEVL